MMRLTILLFSLCFASVSFADEDATRAAVRELLLGEAYFYAYQGKYVEAIGLLDAKSARFYKLNAPNLDAQHFQKNFSRFSSADLDSSYQTVQRVGRAGKGVYEANVERVIRNEEAYRQARIFFQKGRPEKALLFIEKITGLVPRKIRDDVLFLRAQIYMGNGKPAEAAKVLVDLLDAGSFEGLAAYNLGIALIQSGHEQDGLAQLDKTGQMESDNEVALAIRDKANLHLAYRQIEKKQPALAKQYFDRVRLTGPFSNKALLGSGWADVTMGDFERALVPWSVLVKRNAADSTVQESMLAVPYAYAKLGLHGKAAQLYGSALENFAHELGKLDASIQSVNDGHFLQALAREELQQDRSWLVKLRDLPGAPETYYLLDLMATNEFQETLNTYLELEDSRKRLAAWDETLNALEELVALRKRHYDPLLAVIDKRFKEIDTKLMLSMKLRQDIEDRSRRLVERKKHGLSSSAGDVRPSLSDDEIIEIFKPFVRMRLSATLSYIGYDSQMKQLKSRVRAVQDQVNTLLVQQGHQLEVMAINALDVRRKRLDEYQVQVRFALADSYERAAKTQNPEREVK